MKQETGKTNHIDKNSLSIQIRLNGLSFFNKESSSEQFVDFNDKVSVKSIFDGTILSTLAISVVSSRFVMMPEEFYDSTKEHLYFTAKGITVAEDEFIISSVFEDIRFVFLINSPMKEFLSFANKLCGEVVIEHVFTKNLRSLKSDTKEQLTLTCFQHSMYVSFHRDHRLIFADLFDVNSKKMIVDFVDILIRRLNIKRATILLTNDFDASLKSVLSKKCNVRSLCASVFYSDSL